MECPLDSRPKGSEMWGEEILTAQLSLERGLLCLTSK